MTHSYQEDVWTSTFGKEYSDRNTFDIQALNELYLNRYGFSRTTLNDDFLANLQVKDKNILEVGCNVGNQLLTLQSQGYTHLYGIELQSYAYEQAKARTKGINVLNGYADNLPFKDGFFEMVFTSSVLIHIPDEILDQVMNEMYRCSNKYIWGLEYYADNNIEINYRGFDNLLWKRNYMQLFLDKFPDLEVVKVGKYPYLNEENCEDIVYLLKKK